MSTFGDDLTKFSVKTGRLEQDVFVGCTEEVHRSIVEGSEITGAPGQPVDTANLRNSWTPQFLDANTWQDTTHVEYAEYVEDNVRGVTFKNHGPHSVKLTRVGFPKIVEVVTRRVNAGS
jgi:hypothetical protein